MRVALILALILVGTAVVIGWQALFGVGPTAIHNGAVLGSRIHVCARDYNGYSVISRADWPSDAPFVLVDPAPFAPCAPAVEDPAEVCSSGQVICATWTVVFVRIGPDAYAEYELVGGP